MKRREFIKVIGGGVAAWPLSAGSQQVPGRVYRVGYLMISSPEQQRDPVRAFEDGLRTLGYRIGENVVIEYRFAGGQMGRLPVLAEELVRLGVDVIVAGGNPNTAAVMKATAVIPVVMPNSVDPVGAGLIASLARPGGNITGFSMDTGDVIQGKRLELLKETVPNRQRIGILWNPDFAPNQTRLTAMKEAALLLGLSLGAVEVRGLHDLEPAFAILAKQQMQAVFVLADAVLFNYRQQIGVMAVKNGLPAGSAFREFAEAGLLWTYGVDVQDLFRRSATLVDKILKGEKPANLPVEQPTKFEFVINLKTAKELGLEISPTTLARADKVIE